MERAAVTPGARQVREHLFEALLPAWLEHGLDRDRGGFHNRLRPDLSPVPDDFKRLRVQARQTWVFSHAATLGAPRWARETADHGYAFLVERFLDRSRGGWFGAVDLNGRPSDTRKDTYDHAFVLFALAAYFRCSGDADALRLASDTLSVLELHLADSERGGFLEGGSAEWIPERGRRRQNPHMHLLEACLALGEVSGEARYLDRAREVLGLLRDHFFREETGTLGEYFDERWQPAPGEQGAIVEPGHHFEWFWLLRRCREAVPDGDRAVPDGGKPGHEAIAERLLRFALEHGVDTRHGGVYDAVDRAGRVVRGTRRVWPQTERISALATRDDRAALGRAIDHCFRHYVRADAGVWHERLGPDGRIVSHDHPATTPYHIVQALSDALPVLEREPPDPRPVP